MTRKKQAPKNCQECSRWKEVKHKLRISESLAKTIAEIENRMSSKEFKPTLGDYLKLLQMEKEFEEETPKEIRVTWVEPETSGSEK